VVDYTKIPTELEQKFDALDEDNALRPTIINPGTMWSKSFQKSLLSEPESTTLNTEVCSLLLCYDVIYPLQGRISWGGQSDHNDHFWLRLPRRTTIKKFSPSQSFKHDPVLPSFTRRRSLIGRARLNFLNFFLLGCCSVGI
jgi:hypothetical protein